jgi:rhodanese-related sulfurtransferase
MRKSLLSVLFALPFAAAPAAVSAQHQYSAATLAKIEELKILSRDKRDMVESMPGIKKITGDELKSWLDQGRKFVLLDNRVAGDYEKEHIPGSQRLAPDDLLPNPRLAEKYGKDDVIVNYCNGIKCWRSSGTMVLMQDMGYKNLYWYRDGLPEWVKKGYATVEGKEPGSWKK